MKRHFEQQLKDQLRTTASKSGQKYPNVTDYTKNNHIDDKVTNDISKINEQSKLAQALLGDSLGPTKKIKNSLQVTDSEDSDGSSGKRMFVWPNVLLL